MLKKLMRKKTTDIQSLNERIEIVKKRQIPNHIAIIMDGNGRWAKQRKMPRIAGHHEGMKKVRQVTNFANDLEVKVLTLYAFSTENWKRPKIEVDFLMNLPGEFLNTYIPELMEKDIKVEMIGNMDALPAHTRNAIEKAMEITKDNQGLILNFAMNYGSRIELVHVMKELAHEVAEGRIEANSINESVINSKLMTAHLPEPDVLIRTSGEVRLSNFMLWQLAYAEFIFTEVLWPDYNEDCLLQAIEEFQNRDRRFGSLEGDQKG
ncbi:isoprenyl transferase [Sporosarcina sp. GW1-11]|uniref:isoprenyl transferase n=1 Tax=Sporosarcina sp. GW1-11 TaxID=2899126 RepID=UPI00294E88AA|nr:isoprenyl transferase [Sporosarcina sp. GW1-11]MDV6376684.1 isoprenyl transferase [Sporosarcina sp. GW1-11]